MPRPGKPGRPRTIPRRRGQSRRAAWNAARRADLPPDLCPVCGTRPRAVKLLKDGREKMMSKCAEDLAHAAAWARRKG
jgi:hypothetical protein